MHITIVLIMVLTRASVTDISDVSPLGSRMKAHIYYIGTNGRTNWY